MVREVTTIGARNFDVWFIFVDWTLAVKAVTRYRGGVSGLGGDHGLVCTKIVFCLIMCGAAYGADVGDHSRKMTVLIGSC